MRKSFYLFAASLSLSVALIAQTSPSAEGPRISYWVGASVSTFNPDWGCSSNSPFSCWSRQLIGIAPYMDTSAFLLGRIGAEAEMRFLRWHGPAGLTEDHYLVGPRVRLFDHRKMNFSGKFLFGKGHISLPSGAAESGNYFVYAPGAAIDYRLSRRLAARIDYEYQRWPDFKGSATGGGHGGLTPNGLSFGASYAIR